MSGMEATATSIGVVTRRSMSSAVRLEDVVTT